MERGTFPKVRVTYHHMMCQHCQEAPCIEACPSHAIYRRPDGIVVIDPEKCRGHKMCIAACPYESVIWFNDDLNIAQKCTFCAHLLDQGWTETRCSDACPTGALTFGDEEDPKIRELLARAEPLRPDLPTRPRVLYLNLPKKWIAGAVFDPEADICLEGATVRAANTKTGQIVTAVTDNYGDFWPKDVPEGEYVITIEKEGYLPHKVGPVEVTAADVNVGDIGLWRG